MPINVEKIIYPSFFPDLAFCLFCYDCAQSFSGKLKGWNHLQRQNRICKDIPLWSNFYNVTKEYQCIIMMSFVNYTIFPYAVMKSVSRKRCVNRWNGTFIWALQWHSLCASAASLLHTEDVKVIGYKKSFQRNSKVAIALRFQVPTAFHYKISL